MLYIELISNVLEVAFIIFLIYFFYKRGKNKKEGIPVAPFPLWAKIILILLGLGVLFLVVVLAGFGLNKPV
jgi:hypothetical protein